MEQSMTLSRRTSVKDSHQQTRHTCRCASVSERSIALQATGSLESSATSLCTLCWALQCSTPYSMVAGGQELHFPSALAAGAQVRVCQAWPHLPSLSGRRPR